MKCFNCGYDGDMLDVFAIDKRGNYVMVLAEDDQKEHSALTIYVCPSCRAVMAASNAAKE